MRFPVAALMFLCASFIFFIIWAIMTYIVNTFYNTFSPLSSTITNSTDRANYLSELGWIQTGFGIICVLFFIVGIILVFILESWSDEPEYYYRP